MPASLLAGMGFCALSASGETPRVAADVASLDFGQVDPARPASVVPGRVNLFVSGDAAFQVSIATSPETLAAGRLPPARLAWRIPGDRFRELTPMVPTPIASGQLSPAVPSKVTLDLEPLIGWDTPPGRYAARLQFFVNGAVTPDSIRMTFFVPERVEVAVGPQPLDSPAINPLQPDAYPYRRRMALVTSNVRWKLMAWIEGPARKGSSARILSASEFRIAAPPNPPVPLAPGVRTVLARGEPTGSGPRGVAIDIWVDVKGGEVAGRYQTRLHFSAEPDAADFLK